MTSTFPVCAAGREPGAGQGEDGLVGRVPGEEQVRTDARVETPFVLARVLGPEQKRGVTPGRAATWLLVQQSRRHRLPRPTIWARSLGSSSRISAVPAL